MSECDDIKYSGVCAVCDEKSVRIAELQADLRNEQAQSADTIRKLQAQVEAPPDYKRFLRAIKLAEGNGPIEGKLWAWAWKMAALEAGGE